MRKVITIARNELFTLFYSPIAWVMLVLFAVATSLEYVNLLESYIATGEVKGVGLMYLENMSREFINPRGSAGLFSSVIKNLYIFLPLLTMGLISRETSSGTIKLLYSSPLRIREIVLGKYLAIVGFAACMMLVIVLMIVCFMFSITHPDIPQILTSLTILFLIMCCYAAVGLFISSLTTYQIVAAIGTFSVFAILNNIGFYWQTIEIVRNVTYYLTIWTKSINSIMGLISLRDVSYFFILIGTFLSLTIIKLKSGTESIPRIKLVSRYAAVFALAFLLGFITTRKSINIYYDTTRNKDLTITKPTQELLARLDQHELKVTLYSNLLTEEYWSFSPQYFNSLDRIVWEPIYRFKTDFSLNAVYYYNMDSTNWRFKSSPGKTLKELAEIEAKAWGTGFDRFLSPQEVNKQIDILKEENRNFFLIEYGDKRVIVRNFGDPQRYPSEFEIAAGLQQFLGEGPKVVFLTGEMERNPFGLREHDYNMSTRSLGDRYALINQGFSVDTTNLNTNLKGDAAVLVIADPRVKLAPDKVEKINTYIAEGGNLLLLTEPDSWQNLAPVLDKLGISIRPGILVQPSETENSDVVTPQFTSTAKNLDPSFLKTLTLQTKYFGDSIFTLRMLSASAMDYQPVDSFTIDPLLITNENLSWNRVAPIPKDSLRVRLKKTPGDEQGKFTTAVRMHRTIRGKEQRIIVASDADYMAPLGMRGGRFNYEYQLWCYRYFTYGKFPTITVRPASIDDKFKITRDGFFAIQKMFFWWIMPPFILLIGTIILIRRKRK